MFQQSVNRNYPTGFPGDIVRDGPMRAKPGRIASANDFVNNNTNRISRAFGFASDQSYVGQNGQTQVLAAFNYEVTLGGPNFYGVLGHPKHYVLTGGNDGGPLSAQYELPQYFEGEFFDMVTGMVAEIFNLGTDAQNVGYGASLGYVSSATTAAQNANKVPLGGLVAFTGAAPAGITAIPNARVINPVSLAASSPTATVSTWTIIQLTQ